MNISILKTGLANVKNFKKIFKKIKEVFKLPYAKLYLIASIVLIFVFFIVTFPYEVLIIRGIKSLEKSAVRSITMDSINFSFFGTSDVTGINITLPSNDEVKIKELLIGSLSPFGIYFRKKINTSVQANQLKYISKEVNVSLDLSSNIDLELNKKTLQAENGSLNFIINKLKVKLDKLDLGSDLSMLELPDELSFSSINLRSQLANKNLTITNLKIIGNQVSGTITGTIGIHSLFRNSQLNLMLKIESNSAIIQKYKAILEGMKYINSEGKIQININGSIARPKIKIMKGDSGSDDSKTDKKMNSGDKPPINPIQKRIHAKKFLKKGFEEHRDPLNKNKDDD